MDIPSLKKGCTMKKYDSDRKITYLQKKLGSKDSLFIIKNDTNIITATYLPYNLEFVYIPEGVYNKGLSDEEKNQARKINDEISFEKDDMEFEKDIHVSDMLVH